MDAQVKGTRIAPADSEKAKALQVALAQIDKQFGKGTIMRLGDEVLPSKSSPPAPLPWTLRLELAACRAAASWKSTARNRRVRPPLPCTL